MLDAGNGEHFSAGQAGNEKNTDKVLQERQFDLHYHNGERSILVGSLHLQLDLAAMRQQILSMAPVVLLQHLMTVLLLAVLLSFAVFRWRNRYAGSQLRALTDWAERGDIRALVQLPDDGGGSDELNRIGHTINRLCQQLQQVMAERDDSDRELQQLKNQLEQKVEERTGELNNAILSLNRLLDTLQENQHEQVENEKMAQLGSLVAGVAHELNTPLGICVTARSYIEDSVLLIQQRVKDGSLDKNTFSAQINNISEGLLLIDENLNRSHRLMRTFKSLAVDKESDFRSRFSLEEFLQDFSGNSNDFFVEDNTCRIEYDLSQPFILNTCLQTLGLVVGALIGNSLDHGYPEGGDIYIQMHAYVDVSENLLTLIYKDDGVGISNEVREHIFDPFFTTGRNRGKTGLGMQSGYTYSARQH